MTSAGAVLPALSAAATRPDTASAVARSMSAARSTPSHRQGAMSEKISDCKGIGARERSESAGSMPQIVQPPIRDTDALAQPLPSLLRGADGERLARVEPVDHIAVAFLDRIEDRHRCGAEMYRASATLRFRGRKADSATRQVDVGPGERERFAEPHAGGGEQADQ